MQQRTRTYMKLASFLLCLSMVTDFVSSAIDQESRKHEEVVSDLIELLDQERTLRDQNETDYENALMEIVQGLYGGDEYWVGGLDSDEGQSVQSAYSAIMNRTRNYRELLSDIRNYFDARSEYLTTIPSVWPVDFNEFTRITSGFGYRSSPISGRITFHRGIDIATVWRARIIAPADGVVIESWPAPDGYWRGHPQYGGMVKIQHADGFETLYAHMNRVLVTQGTVLSQGDVIGIIGDTGQSRGQHLHYEVILNGEPVNPLDYLNWF